jgi:hypothetical protein
MGILSDSLVTGETGFYQQHKMAQSTPGMTATAIVDEI